MLEHERAQLMPMPAPFDGYVEEVARVSSTCLVSVASQPLLGAMRAGRADGQHAPVPDAGDVVAGDVVVAEHERLTDKGKTRYDWQHYIPLVRGSLGRCAMARRSRICLSPCSGCGARCCARAAATA